MFYIVTQGIHEDEDQYSTDDEHDKISHFFQDVPSLRRLLNFPLYFKFVGWYIKMILPYFDCLFTLT